MAQPVLLWLRQDLRTADHPALAAAAAKGEVIPLYVLDDETPGHWRWGGASRWWLHHALAALGQQLPLVLRQGRADHVIAEVLKKSGAASLHFTRDYAPWSPALEKRVRKICEDLGVECHRYGGYLMYEPEAIRNGQGETYKVFTPFSRACFGSGEPRAPKPAAKFTIAKHELKSDKLESWKLTPSRPDWAKGFGQHWQPGEAGAHRALVDFIDNGLEGYADGRDRPDQNYISRLSPRLHWGELSPHQVWHAVRGAMARHHGKLDSAGEKFLTELLWREFSHHLLMLFPDFPSKSYRPEFDDMPWAHNAVHLHAWQKGLTGYPIVDAGMRELWATGFMHNRVRMIVASFLIKHLQIDWRKGEEWFWDTLLDADIANNAASWQWVAGSGADASPYYRIFNPIMQGEKFDPEGAYVKRWVPELKDVDAEFIHAPWKMKDPPANYPAPLVDHFQARDRAMAALAQIKKDKE